MSMKNSTTMFNDLLLECMTKPDPMLHLLKRLCNQLMEAEISSKLSACKGGNGTPNVWDIAKERGMKTPELVVSDAHSGNRYARST